MCGICGVVSADRRQAQPAVRNMMRAMVHRGPNDEGYSELPLGGPDGPVAGFGFRRLSILDLTPAGHQPMVNPDTGDCLVFNGEIYNFRSLRERLLSRGVHVRSSGDTEVLLKALSLWGEKTLDDLDGMFAFAFYEAKTRRILLARDPLGIKPLYISQLPRAFVFASEVQAILASGLVPDDLDPAGIATFLAYGAPQDPLTVHRHIRSMAAGTFQWLSAAAASGHRPHAAHRYWHFPEARPPFDEHSASNLIRDQLDATVRDHCLSDVPMAVFLSSGIDSATVAALAKRHVKDVRTFSVGNEDSPEEDEIGPAAETARLLGTNHSQMVLDKKWIYLQWREWLACADRPSVDGLNTFVVSAAVREEGNTVALSGLGADELFGGYYTFDEVRLRRRLLSGLQWLPRRTRQSLATIASLPFSTPRRNRIRDILGTGISVMDLTLHLHRLMPDHKLRSFGLHQSALGLTEHWLPPEAYEPFVDIDRDLFRAISQVETFLYMGNTLLRDTDANSMAHSVEIRVPFLGRRVVETVGAIPGSMQLPPGPARKHLLRKAMENDLPPAVFNRPKRGFQLPIGLWMSGPLRDQCEAAVERTLQCPLLDSNGVRSAWDLLRSQSNLQPWTKSLGLVVLGEYLTKLGAVRSVAPAACQLPVLS